MSDRNRDDRQERKAARDQYEHEFPGDWPEDLYHPRFDADIQQGRTP